MQKNKYQGKFIVLDGLDGSGQSTMAELLSDYLKSEKNIENVLTKEPTQDTETGKKIKEVLRASQKAEPMELQKLFAQDRAEHLEKVIIPALESGKFIICDRYFFSSLAFGSCDGLDLDWLIRLNDGFLYPDLTIVLKVRPEVCMERLDKKEGKKNIFEKTEKLKRAWETYEILPERFADVAIIDGEKSIEEVFDKIKETVKEKILEKIEKMPNLN